MSEACDERKLLGLGMARSEASARWFGSDDGMLRTVYLFLFPFLTSSNTLTNAGVLSISFGDLLILSVPSFPVLGTYWFGSGREVVEPTYIPGRRRTCSRGDLRVYSSSRAGELEFKREGGEGRSRGRRRLRIVFSIFGEG